MNNNVLKGSLVYKGENGKSAYELAVQEGFEGTLQDWLGTYSDTMRMFNEYKEEYVTTESTSTFLLPEEYINGAFVDIYVEGLHIPSDEYEIEEVTVDDTLRYQAVLDTAVATNKKVEISVLVMGHSSSLPITDTITSTSTNTTASGTKSVYDYIESKKSTSIGSASTDNTFPTSKAVYEKCESIKGDIPSLSTVVDLIYPVGSIYMTVNDVNPSNIFNGTGWEKIKDRFLLAAGDTYANASTGGSATHKHTTGNHALTVNQMPRHNHSVAPSNYPLYTLPNRFAAGNRDGVGAFTYSSGHAITFTSGQTGGGAAHNHGDTGTSSNMPPYLTVYMWKRVA